MKGVLIIIDGVADEHCAILMGKTPLEIAKTPNLDWFSESVSTCSSDDLVQVLLECTSNGARRCGASSAQAVFGKVDESIWVQLARGPHGNLRRGELADQDR